MTPEQNLLDLKQREAISPKRFDPRSATPFVNKSVSFQISLLDLGVVGGRV